LSNYASINVFKYFANVVGGTFLKPKWANVELACPVKVGN